MTLLLWLVAIGQVVLFGLQLSLMRTGLKPTIDAANAAKKSADALALIERAYIFLDEAHITNFATASVVTTNDAEGKNVSHRAFTIKFTFRNHGKTPAILKELFGEAKLCKDFSEATNAKGTFFAPGQIVSASNTTTFLVEFVTDASQFERAKTTGKPKLLFFGSISYYDVLKEERATGFCWKYDFSRQEFRLSLDSEHNYWT